jgi:predicted nucleotidyltransferase
MTLLDDVAETLEGAGIPFALVGAGALAVYGVVRSTFDHDLLTTNPRVLNEAFWHNLRPAGVVDARRGEEDDPLAGVVRLTAPGERDVDLIVGREGWLDGVIARHIKVPLAGRDVAVVTAADLLLLKLYAGGTQDRWDIEQVLAVVPDTNVREDVESRLSDLPPYAGALWQQLVSPRG